MKENEITCKDCYRYGDTHSSCSKSRNGLLTEDSPACSDIKLEKKCVRDCYEYGDPNSSCERLKEGKIDEDSIACKNIKLRRETIQFLKEIRGELVSNQEIITTNKVKIKNRLY